MRRVGAAAGTLGVVLLAACSGSGSSAVPGSSSTTATVGAAPTASASATPTPDATAQAATDAKAAYERYVEVVDSVYQQGGRDAASQLAQVAVGVQLSFLVNDARRLETNHWHQTGASRVRKADVQAVKLKSAQSPQVVLTTCLDFSATDVVDTTGKSIRKPGSLTAFNQVVTLIGTQGNHWLVSQEDDKPVKAC